MSAIEEWATLKFAKCEGDVVDGEAVLLLKVPGTPGSKDGRVISGGAAWFETPHVDDSIKVYIIDKDNLSGAGVDTVVGTYTDTEVPEECQGWHINIHKKYVEMKELSNMGFIPAGFYLKIIGIKGDDTADKLRINVKWGKRE